MDPTVRAISAVGPGKEIGKDLANLFEDSFHWETGWNGGWAEERYARLAADAWHSLRHEVGDDVEVLVDLWPVRDGDLVRWLRQQGIEPHPVQPN